MSDTNVFFVMQYPREVKHFQYDPYFAIRGLHLDVETVSNGPIVPL